jgi:hypothetical protein
MPKTAPTKQEQELIAKILSFRDDPEGFIMYVFPWQKPGTPLANHKGPREWQLRTLRQIKAHIANNHNRVLNDQDPELMRIARASGRGIGKSAFIAWISIWLFSTHPAATVIVSANTEQQLSSTTFPEIRKWATMSIHAHWFEHNAMSLKPQSWLAESLKATAGYDDAYWYIMAKLWSSENPDAYAGPHSQMAMAVLFDEASGIDSVVWPVANGYFTDKTVYRFWLAISNPRNPSGAFFQCFNRNRDRWNNESIDARTVKENDQGVYQSIIDEHGIDSDEARVEVYGQFPKQGDENFISRGAVEEAVQRELEPDPGAPMIMGVDPARMGRDKAVIRFRQGRDARSIKPIVYPKCTTAEMAEYCADAIEKYKPDSVMIEGDGIGGPVAELLKAAGYRVTEVLVGASAQDPSVYYKHRTELWGRMRTWLDSGCLPDEPELIEDLSGMRYSFNLSGQLALWPKDKMKKLGFASPDYADALAMTFSKTVARKDRPTSKMKQRRREAKGMDYSVI